MSLLLLCVCLFVVICSVSNVGILCVFFSSLVGSFGCGTTWIWCWNLLPFDQRFFISRQLVTFYLHFFANFARRFGSHMVHFSHLCQIWRSSAPLFCFPCGDFEMRMSISIYTIVITFIDLKQVITMITWHFEFSSPFSHKSNEYSMRCTCRWCRIGLVCNLENFRWPWHCKHHITYCHFWYIIHALNCRTMPNPRVK